jgi:RPA family protein
MMRAPDEKIIANRINAPPPRTATESVNDDMLRARIVDPTGAFVAYAGQYQPDALAFFERATPPAFVALTAKARTFQPEDSEQVFTSARPETVNDVDADTRDRWTVSAAEATLQRVSLFDAALSSGLRGDDLESHLREHGVEEALAAGIPRAIEHYGTTTAYLDAVRQLALDALSVVAGEREEVRELSLSPEEGGAAALGKIPAALRAEDSIATPETSAPSASGEPESAVPAETSMDDSATTADDLETSVDDSETTAATDAASDTGAESAADPAGASDTAPEPASAPADSTEASESSTEATGATAGTADPASDTDTGAESQPDSTGSDELGSFDDSLSDEIDAGDDATADEPEQDVGADASAEVDLTADSAATADAETTSGEVAADTEQPADEADVDVADDELYEFDEEEREAVREEHGLSFESGAEVDSPGEAGIETPDAEEIEAESSTDEPAETAEATPEVTESVGEESTTADVDPDEDEASGSSADSGVESGAATEADAAGARAEDAAETEHAGESDEPAAEVDLSEVVVDVMDDLDDGDGADREKVIAAVVQRSGADPGAAEDAIQEALMDGKCYEPGEGRLKAI